MPTLMSAQRVHHAFHPYRSTYSHPSTNIPVSCRVRGCAASMSHSMTKTAARHEASRPDRRFSKNEPRSSRSLEHYNAHPVAFPISPPCGQASMQEDPSGTTPPHNGPPASHSHTLALPSPLCPNASPDLRYPTNQPVREPAAARSPAPTNSSGCPGSMLTQQTTPTSNTCRPVNGSSSRNTQAYHRDIVSYLKAWRPPVEYYARRRYHHPSLSYPSRRPSLPSLLEERITHDGHLDVVCPQSAMATSLRAYRKRIFPSHLSSNTSSPPPNLHLSAPPAWSDDESDDDLESDDDSDDDADQDDHQSDDEDENITPRNSPASTSTYFLQPLVLTKLPGYP